MCSDVADRLSERGVVHVRGDPAGEERKLRPGAIGGFASGPPEPERWEHPFEKEFAEVRAADGVQRGSGECIVLAVAAYHAVIHPVVAEASEIEIRKRFRPVPGGITCRRTEPDGRMVDREERPALERTVDSGVDHAVHFVIERGELPADAVLFLHRPE